MSDHSHQQKLVHIHTLFKFKQAYNVIVKYRKTRIHLLIRTHHSDQYMSFRSGHWQGRSHRPSLISINHNYDNILRWEYLASCMIKSLYIIIVIWASWAHTSKCIWEMSCLSVYQGRRNRTDKVVHVKPAPKRNPQRERSYQHGGSCQAGNTSQSNTLRQHLFKTYW